MILHSVRRVSYHSAPWYTLPGMRLGDCIRRDYDTTLLDSLSSGDCGRVSRYVEALQRAECAAGMLGIRAKIAMVVVQLVWRVLVSDVLSLRCSFIIYRSFA